MIEFYRGTTKTNLFEDFETEIDLEQLESKLSKRYPDYYHLRGRDAENLSELERTKVNEILKSEFNI